MGYAQEIETLIDEEASLFVMFLRQERQTWKLRIAGTLGSLSRLGIQLWKRQ
jgi:hypothetical protein